jgi:alcohol dehydrogenase
LAVFGCGGLGLSAIMIGVALGARVLAVDSTDGALRRAAELGADTTVRADGAADLAGRIRQITGGGAQVTIDAVGAPALAAAGLRSLRRRGRHVQVGLLLGDDAAAALPMDLVISRELEIYGSHGMPAVDYPAMLDGVTAGLLNPARLVGRTIGLDEAGRALAAMDGPGGPGITVIVP